MKYYEKLNISMPIRVGASSYSFEPVEFSGGTYRGVLSVKDSEAEIFESVALKLGVSQITKKEYDALLEKKTEISSFNSSSVRPMPGNQITQAKESALAAEKAASAMKGNGGVVVDGSTITIEKEASHDEGDLQEFSVKDALPTSKKRK